jgi:archaemetzincin
MAGDVDSEAAAYAERCLSLVLGVETRRLDPFPEISYARDEARGQYSSTLVLRDSLPRRPAEAAKLLVLTERDIFIPMLSFVYGQAQLEGRAAVVSLARLRPEFHGLAPDEALLARRAATEAVHEVGHTLGLVHCLDRRCPMSLSIDLTDLDRKTAEPCPGCSALVEGSSAIRRARAVAEGGRR